MLHKGFITFLSETWAQSPLGACSIYVFTTYLAFFFLTWGFFRAIYLLYFHPLASFPGPYKAALSTWWLYAVNKTGQAEETFEVLHQKYNTRALRIAPNELHITDPGVYHTIYSQSRPFLKYEEFYKGFNTTHSLFIETDKNLHRERRKVLNNFFSKSAVRSMQKVLLPMATVLCNKISERKSEGPINVHNAIRCLTVDFITEFAFGESLGLLNEAKDRTFYTRFVHAFDLAADGLWDQIYIPFLRIIRNKVPPTLARKLSTTAARFQDLWRAIEDTVIRYKQSNRSSKSLDHEVVFDYLQHLDDDQLLTEAVDILIAGSDTTAFTLAAVVKELSQNSEISGRLEKEIKEAGLKAEQDYELGRLESLPYLSACVKEAMRYAMASPGRLPRVVPNGTPLVIDNKTIPPGSVVGMSAYSMHFNEDIWGEDARTYNPARWQTGNAKELEKYLVTFSKGPRQCLGINLAYAEVTIVLAMLVNRFRFTPDETLTESDLVIMDNFTRAWAGAGGQVIVHEHEK